MNPRRPEVFISATSKDLSTTRQVVRDALLAIGCHPVLQEHFGPDARTVREMIRRHLAECDAVIHLAGACYGAEAPWEGRSEARRSYTQLEYDLARELGKPLYIFVCPESYPYDAHEAEPEELRALQQSHRTALLAGEQLYEQPRNPQELAMRIREFQTRLEVLTHELKQTQSWLTRGVLVCLAGLLLLVGGVWVVKQQTQRTETTTQNLDAEIRRLMAELEREREATKADRALVRDVLEHAREQRARGKDDPILELQSYVAEERNISVEQLRAQLDDARLGAERRLALTEQLDAEIKRQSASLTEARETVRRQRVQAVLDSADAEQSAGHFPAAARLLANAEKLTDRQRDPLEWAEVQARIGKAAYLQGQFAEAERRARDAFVEFQRAKGGEDTATLAVRRSIAYALNMQGKAAEAETEHRALLPVCGRVFGPENALTLSTRHGLAIALFNQRKFADAEAENRAVLEIRQRVLGPEHRDTLASRNDLANAIDEQGRHVEAETEYRALLASYEHVLTPEHPDTLGVRSNLADVLQAQGKFAEAETEARAVLRMRERVLPPGHPDTLISCFNLAEMLDKQNRPDDARPFARRAAEGARTAFPPTHPARRQIEELARKLGL